MKVKYPLANFLGISLIAVLPTKYALADTILQENVIEIPAPKNSDTQNKQSNVIEMTSVPKPKNAGVVVAIEDVTAPKKIKNIPSPDSVFHTYKKAVVAGDIDAYKRFYSQALLAKTDKQLADYTERQTLNVKRWNQKLMSCQDNKLVSQQIIGNKATNIYELTDSCNKNKKSKSYQRVKFILQSTKDSEGKHWKIDGLTMSSKNDFDEHGYLRFKMGVM